MIASRGRAFIDFVEACFVFGGGVRAVHIVIVFAALVPAAWRDIQYPERRIGGRRVAGLADSVTMALNCLRSTYASGPPVIVASESQCTVSGLRRYLDRELYGPFGPSWKW